MFGEPSSAVDRLMLVRGIAGEERVVMGDRLEFPFDSSFPPIHAVTPGDLRRGNKYESRA